MPARKPPKRAPPSSPPASPALSLLWAGTMGLLASEPPANSPSSTPSWSVAGLLSGRAPPFAARHAPTLASSASHAALFRSSASMRLPRLPKRAVQRRVHPSVMATATSAPAPPSTRLRLAVSQAHMKAQRERL